MVASPSYAKSWPGSSAAAAWISFSKQAWSSQCRSIGFTKLRRQKQFGDHSSKPAIRRIMRITLVPMLDNMVARDCKRRRQYFNLSRARQVFCELLRQDRDVVGTRNQRS